MTIPTSLARVAQGAASTSSPVLSDPAALRTQQRQQLRRYEVSALQPDGSVAEVRHIAPALPLFEDAFCAFSRGSLIETEHGPAAIEDIQPGERVITADGHVQPLLWKGSTVIVPGRPGPNGRNMRLTRIMADSFGMQRPYSFVLAGPSARLLGTPAHLRAEANGAPMLTPVQEFVDGNNVVETAPPTAVELFHICLKRHTTIRIGGLEFETYHPGPHAPRMISHSMRSLFFNMFPHIGMFGDFGPLAYTRAGESQRPSAMIA
ncbi:Hint domain-containing protein [Seohaeicola nanhaiensis]|uniref:Hint domain-containing protein n=1 Tax=Seohaeicola nanhaiensis TaxID=1387282 RepID=A0ABV9KCJ6_9RHOB